MPGVGLRVVHGRGGDRCALSALVSSVELIDSNVRLGEDEILDIGISFEVKIACRLLQTFTIIIQS